MQGARPVEWWCRYGLRTLLFALPSLSRKIRRGAQAASAHDAVAVARNVFAFPGQFPCLTVPKTHTLIVPLRMEALMQ